MFLPPVSSPSVWLAVITSGLGLVFPDNPKELTTRKLKESEWEKERWETRKILLKKTQKWQHTEMGKAGVKCKTRVQREKTVHEGREAEKATHQWFLTGLSSSFSSLPPFLSLLIMAVWILYSPLLTWTDVWDEKSVPSPPDSAELQPAVSHHFQLSYSRSQQAFI